MSAPVGIVLAAGQGSRLGGPKALLLWPSPDKGQPTPLGVAHAEALLAAGCSHVLVVLRQRHLRHMFRFAAPGIDFVASDAPEEQGPAGSLARAITSLGAAELVVVTPVDALPVRAEILSRLLERIREPDAPLAVRPRYEDKRGHPVVLRELALAPYRAAGSPPPLRDHLKELGARAAEVEVDEAGVLADIDRPGDVVRYTGALPVFLA